MKRILLGLLLLSACLPVAPAIAQPSAKEQVDAALKQAERELEASKKQVQELEALNKRNEAGGNRARLADKVDLSLIAGNVKAATDLAMDYRKKNPKDYGSYQQLGRIKLEYLQDVAGALGEVKQATVLAKQELEEMRNWQKKDPKPFESATLMQEVTGLVQQMTAQAEIYLLVAESEITGGKQSDRALGAALQLFKQGRELMLDESKGKYSGEWEQFLLDARCRELLILQEKILKKNSPEKAEKFANFTKQTQVIFDDLVKMAEKYGPDKVKREYSKVYLHRAAFRARVLNDLSGAKADARKAYQLEKAVEGLYDPKNPPEYSVYSLRQSPMVLKMASRLLTQLGEKP